MTWPAFPMLLLAVPLVYAALHDIAFRTVPDWVSLALALAGVGLRIRDHRLLAGLGCGVLVFALAAFCWRRGWLGGGDVKLLGAASIVMPPGLVPDFIAGVALAGGGLALVYLLLERLVPVPRAAPARASLVRRILAAECWRIRRRASLPYATAISAAALLLLVRG